MRGAWQANGIKDLKVNQITQARTLTVVSDLRNTVRQSATVPLAVIKDSGVCQRRGDCHDPIPAIFPEPVGALAAMPRETETLPSSENDSETTLPRLTGIPGRGRLRLCGRCES